MRNAVVTIVGAVAMATLQAPEGGQNVNAQDGFVGVPAPLAGLGMGQVAISDELVER